MRRRISETISQSSLEQLLKDHNDYREGLLGSKRGMLKFMDMSYLGFQGCNLSQADLTGARIGNAILDDGDFRAANMFAVDMRFGSLIGADFSRADMRGCCLRGADMTEANLSEADMRDGTLMRSVKHGELIPVLSHEETSTLDKAILKGADLSEARLPDNFVVQTDMTDCILRNAKFVRADLSYANFTGATGRG